MVLLAALLWGQGHLPDSLPASSPVLPVAGTQSSGTHWAATHDMTSTENATHHFQKHGAEMGYKTEAAYIAAAVDFTTHPPQGTLQTQQRDGDTVFFLPRTGWFAVRTKDGRLRTFFERTDNLTGYISNMEYFNQQARRE